MGKKLSAKALTVFTVLYAVLSGVCLLSFAFSRHTGLYHYASLATGVGFAAIAVGYFWQLSKVR